MDNKPETPLDKFYVETEAHTLRSTHYFPADYDEDCFPIGERHKVAVTICQSDVLVEIFQLLPDHEMGWWRWVRVKDFHISLAMSLHSGLNAVTFTEYDAKTAIECNLFRGETATKWLGEPANG
jgi:hypothetical protein